MAVPALLVFNAGSTSLKFGLFRADGAAGDSCAVLARGRVEWSEEGLSMTWASSGEHPETTRWPGRTPADAPGQVLEVVEAWCGARGLTVVAAGHRVVHGGRDFVAPVRIHAGILARLEALTPLAPLHQPANLAPIRRLLTERPAWAQIACFDTAFHASMPDVARVYGLPLAYAERGFLRYGFHGLACESVMRQLAASDPALAEGRVLIAHLGGGASVTGVVGGRSMHHSMGWSALDGLVMATRCGALDPGLVLALVRSAGSADAVERLLYRESGLLGLSGISADMRSLLASPEPRARLAVDVFVYRAIVELGGAAAAMGEHAAAIRERIVAALGWLGARLDPAANAGGASCLEDASSRVAIRRIGVDEEAVMARHVVAEWRKFV
jgi:acetate kinase